MDIISEQTNRKVNKLISENPYIAWPTVGLALGLLGGNIGSMYIYSKGFHYCSFILSSICSYSHFTVSHDAVHGAISKNKYINDSLGWLSSFWLGPTSNWPAIRYCHLEHHKFTNDPDKDPDYWCSEHSWGGKKLILLRWALIDLHYWNIMYQTIHKHSIDLYIYHSLILIFLCISYYYGYLDFLFWTWILPARVALFSLSFGFDYLPHSPHDIPRQDLSQSNGNVVKGNPHQTTFYLASGKLFKPLFSTIILYQNYHLAHHLYSKVPFYKYKNVWNLIKPDLLSNVRVKNIFPIFGSESLTENN